MHLFHDPELCKACAAPTLEAGGCEHLSKEGSTSPKGGSVLSQAVPHGEAVPCGVSTSRSSPSSRKEPASSQSSELISICLSHNQPEFISNLRFPWMCEAFNKTQSEEMKDLSVCPQRCPLRGQRGTTGAETWIVFYGSCVRRYRAFEVLLAPHPPACPRCHRRGTAGSPRPGTAGSRHSRDGQLGGQSTVGLVGRAGGHGEGTARRGKGGAGGQAGHGQMWLHAAPSVRSFRRKMITGKCLPRR